MTLLFSESGYRSLNRRQYFMFIIMILTCKIAFFSTAFECLMGAILYRNNYTKQEAPKDLNYMYMLPYDEYVLRAGFYLECAAGGLFLFNYLLFILDVIMSNRQDTSSINPILNKESVSSTQSK